MALVQRGVALVVPNIHGSTGYGRAWQVAIHKDWGGIDLRDLRAVTEWMRAQARFDRRRLAVVGGSYDSAVSCLFSACKRRVNQRAPLFQFRAPGC